MSVFSIKSYLKSPEFSVQYLMDRIKPVIVRKLFQQRDITWLVVSFEQFEPSGLQTKEQKNVFFSHNTHSTNLRLPLTTLIDEKNVAFQRQFLRAS